MTVADQRCGMGSVTLADADCLDGQPNPVAEPLDRGSFGRPCAVCRAARPGSPRRIGVIARKVSVVTTDDVDGSMRPPTSGRPVPTGWSGA